ncbi:MAG TPA: LytTR family DNA-binding domain-containing protein [Haloferula sp.]
MTVRTLIVDDSEIDRLNLTSLLDEHPQVKIVGEARTLGEAVTMIDSLEPALVFLDLHLGRELGFSALERTRHQPQVIITTAHPRYALRGFEVEAVDYLLKPVMEETLARALARVSPLQAPPSRLAPDDVQVFKRGENFDVLPVSDILAIGGERIYSRVVARNALDYLHNRRLREWRELLPEEIFKPLDRSTIVNVRELRTIKDAGSEGFRLGFRDSASTVTIGDTAMKALREVLG